MSTEIVEQLKNGVVVRVSDGTEVHCKPLSLADAITFFDLWDIRNDETLSKPERYRARLKMVKAFQKAYPELATRITASDVDAVLPGFFWVESGAGVPAIEALLTGTPPSASTPPDTDARRT